MASLAIGAVGGFFFGPIGFAIGSFIGNLLFPQKGPDGPRLSNLHLTNSSYGQMVPILYGIMRVPGIVTWETDLHEHKNTTGGKGGPEQTTYTYSASFMITLCEGEIAGVSRVWANGTLIWNADGSVGNSFPFTLYLGDELQTQDPTMVAMLGADFVPAYRGFAYVVADEMDLSQYGNVMPTWGFEVTESGSAGSLHIVTQNLNAFTTLPNGFGLTGNLVIYRWSDTATIQVGAQTSQASYPIAAGAQSAFDPTTLMPTTTSGAVVSFPNYWFGPTPNYCGIGFYVYASGASTELWLSFATTAMPIDASGVDANIVTNTVTTTYQDGIYVPSDPTNLCFTAGIPAGEYVMGACLTGDGTSLFVFTSDMPNGAGTRSWWQIKNGINTLAGSLDSTFPALLMCGQSGVNHSGNSVGSAENNGQYFWTYTYSTNTAEVWMIDSSLHLGPVPGMTLVVGTLVAGHLAASIVSYKNGYAGLSVGTGLFLLSRISATVDQITLGQIVSDLSVRAGLATDQIDVSQLTQIVPGYLIDQQQAVKDCITPLQSAWYFDAVESTGVIKFVVRGSNPIITIPDSDLAAVPTGSDPPALVTVKRVQEVDLPQNVTVTYINEAADYQIGSQFSQRQVVESQMAMTVQLTISLSDDKAKEVSNTLLFTAWMERMQFTFITSRQYAWLEPTDVVLAHGYEIRIMSKSNVANDTIQFDGVASLSSIWTSSGPVSSPSTGVTPTSPQTKQAAALLLLDIPLVVDTDDSDGIYAAMAGALSPMWSGAALYQSLDGGGTFNIVAQQSIGTTMGTVTGLPLTQFRGGNMFDEASIFQATIGPGGGELVSANELAVLNGANLALCGSELIQFKNATLVSAGVYNLTGLLRGRRGTEWALLNHVAGERFVMVSGSVDVDETFAQLGQSLQYEAVSFGTSLAPASAIPFTNNGNAALPYSPCELGGGPDASGNVTLNWFRRTRIGGQWVNFTDVPLSEASEAYVVTIWDSTYSNAARIIQVSGPPPVIYTSAQQVTDFGANQQQIFFSVQQVGAFKAGIAAVGIAQGLGGSNAPVSNPVPPVNSPPGPPPGSGACAGAVIGPVVLAYVTGTELTQQLSPGTTWIVQFTTGSGSPTSLGVSNVWCDFGNVQSVLSTLPCGAPLLGFNSGSKLAPWNSHGFFITDNLNTAAFPTLLPSTTYIVSVTTDTPNNNVHIDMNVPT